MNQMELYFLMKNIGNFIGLGVLVLMIIGYIICGIFDYMKNKKEDK